MENNKYADVTYIENDTNTLMQLEIKEVNDSGGSFITTNFEFHLFKIPNKHKQGMWEINFIIIAAQRNGARHKIYISQFICDASQVDEKCAFLHKQYKVKRNAGFLYMNEKTTTERFELTGGY